MVGGDRVELPEPMATVLQTVPLPLRYNLPRWSPHMESDHAYGGMNSASPQTIRRLVD